MPAIPDTFFGSLHDDLDSGLRHLLAQPFPARDQPEESDWLFPCSEHSSNELRIT